MMNLVWDMFPVHRPMRSLIACLVVGSVMSFAVGQQLGHHGGSAPAPTARITPAQPTNGAKVSGALGALIVTTNPSASHATIILKATHTHSAPAPQPTTRHDAPPQRHDDGRDNEGDSHHD